MGKGKPHLEFVALDMEDGWETPAGYPPGMQQKVLTSDLDETGKTGSRTRFLRIAAGEYSTVPFIHDHWEEVHVFQGDLTVPAPPEQEATAETIATGKSAYNAYCLPCHGFSAASSWLVPDLRYMSPERHAAFEDIVLGGILESKGMPQFASYLKPAELPALRSYLIDAAQKLYEEQQREGL